MAATLKKQAFALDSIDSMLREISARDKTASNKGGGETTHPSKNAPDDLHDAPHGERYRENEKDVKEDQGAASVENAKEGGTPDEEKVMPNIGVEQKSTGDDPKNETEGAGAEKKDGGTYKGKSEHPARTDNDSLNGGKYASARKFLELSEKAANSGNTLISEIALTANDAVQQHKAAKAGTPAPAVPAAPAKQADTAPPELASLLCSQVWGNDKQAMQQDVQSALAYTIQDAFSLAEKVAAFVHAAEKQAEEDDKGKPPEAESKDEGKGGGDDGDKENDDDSAAPATPPDMGSEGGGGHDDQALLKMLLGGQSMGGQGAVAGMAGGCPPAPMGAGGGAAPPMGGDPSMGAGGAGGGAMPPIDLQMLLAALQHAGHGGGGAGGAGGGPIPPAAFEAKAAAYAAKLLKEGSVAADPNWKAKDAQEQAQFDATVKYVREIMSK